MCFDLRMEVTADYAAGHDFQVIATTNATSRWKDAEQVRALGGPLNLQVMSSVYSLLEAKSQTLPWQAPSSTTNFQTVTILVFFSKVDASGYKAAARHEALQYWKADWQTDRMTLRKYQVQGRRHWLACFCLVGASRSKPFSPFLLVFV